MMDYHIPFTTKVTYTTNATLVVPYPIIRVKSLSGGGGGGFTGAQQSFGGNGGSGLCIFICW